MTTQKPEGFKTEVDVWTLPAGGEPKKEKILVPGLSGIERSAGKSLVADTLREKASGIVNVKMGPSKHAFDGGGIFGGGKDHYNDLPASRNVSIGAWIAGLSLTALFGAIGLFNIIPTAAAAGYSSAGI
ncbi:MAG: hypothetical protein RLZZ283_373, partial [Candidatus Parcubacteria bacterium]